MDPTNFETHPSRYRHWRLGLAGDTATPMMAVDGEHPHRPGYEVKLNSYDLPVDLQLADAPLLAVLPGTGGLTRLTDKRRVRRDRADVFCTTAEGINGKRARDWGLVDDVVSRSKWDDAVAARARALAARQTVTRGPAV